MTVWSSQRSHRSGGNNSYIDSPQLPGGTVWCWTAANGRVYGNFFFVVNSKICGVGIKWRQFCKFSGPVLQIDIKNKVWSYRSVELVELLTQERRMTNAVFRTTRFNMFTIVLLQNDGCFICKITRRTRSWKLEVLEVYRFRDTSFFVMYYIYYVTFGPSLVIESTDFMIN